MTIAATSMWRPNATLNWLHACRRLRQDVQPYLGESSDDDGSARLLIRGTAMTLPVRSGEYVADVVVCAVRGVEQAAVLE